MALPSAGVELQVLSEQTAFHTLTEPIHEELGRFRCSSDRTNGTGVGGTGVRAGVGAGSTANAGPDCTEAKNMNRLRQLTS